MSRSNRNKRYGKKKYSVIVDGKTEKWYLDSLKKEENIKEVAILPELPQKRNLQEQYKDVCSRAKNYDKVYWIVDLDVILKQTKEYRGGGKIPIEEFNILRRNLETLNNVKVIVNNSCLEFWYLLHFTYTTRKFNNCNEVIRELKKHFSEYEKTENFYIKSKPNLYQRLKEQLPKALENAKKLGNYNPYEYDNSISEMFLFFEDIVSLQKA